jgi:hypothetical protein
MHTEIVGNMHLHTTASDGTGTTDEVAAAAAEAGLDFILYTDHNVWTAGVEGWYHDPASGREILRLMGQEVNDRRLEPEYNHLLCYFVNQDLQPVASKPQALIDTVLAAGGLCFIAHPLERPGIAGHEDIYPWVAWPVTGFTGIELWNTMTEVKWQLRSLGRALLGIAFPKSVLSGPYPETLAKWDDLLAGGQKVVAIGNADAHALTYTKGPLRYQIYAYRFLFRAVNTHLLLDQPLARDIDQARRQVYHALKQGHCFVGYGLPASPRGFTFTAASGGQLVIMGDTLALRDTATLAVSSPYPAYLRLLKDGEVLEEIKGRELTWQTNAPGIYRVEAYRWFWGRRRGWVFTNPIYVV